LQDHGELIIDRPGMRHITHNALLEEQLWKLRIALVIARLQAAFHPILFHQLSGRMPYGFARALRKARQDSAVAKYGSFSKAGAALFRSQSAVSVQVAKLEAALGKRLFDRTTKYVVLTEAGQILLRYSMQLDELMQQAQQELADIDQFDLGLLVLYTSDTTACYRLPALLQHYRACHPG